MVMDYGWNRKMVSLMHNGFLVMMTTTKITLLYCHVYSGDLHLWRDGLGERALKMRRESRRQSSKENYGMEWKGRETRLQK